MTKMPEVTVLMPFHNAARWIAQAVGSIFKQSFTDFELLAIDDGSNDGSDEILRGLGDPRLRLVRIPRKGGIALALNEGIRLANGPLIARQDADDLSSPDRLKLQVEYLTRHPEIAALATCFQVIDQAGKPHSRSVPRSNRILAPPDIQTALRRGNCIAHGTVMGRKQVLQDLGGYRSFPRAQDYDLWLRLTKRYQMGKIPQLLYYYRVHPAQVSRDWAKSAQMAWQIRLMDALDELSTVPVFVYGTGERSCFLAKELKQVGYQPLGFVLRPGQKRAGRQNGLAVYPCSSEDVRRGIVLGCSSDVPGAEMTRLSKDGVKLRAVWDWEDSLGKRLLLPPSTRPPKGGHHRSPGRPPGWGRRGRSKGVALPRG